MPLAGFDSRTPLSNMDPDQPESDGDDTGGEADPEAGDGELAAGDDGDLVRRVLADPEVAQRLVLDAVRRLQAEEIPVTRRTLVFGTAGVTAAYLAGYGTREAAAAPSGDVNAAAAYTQSVILDGQTSSPSPDSGYAAVSFREDRV